MRARSRRLGAALSLTAAALAASVVPAFAHASFDVSKAPADTDVDLVIFAPLERDDTNSRIEALFPTGFDVDGCGGPAAWLCDIEPGSDGTVVTWQTLTPTENDIAFEVAIRTPATPDQYAIPVVQTYSDGTEAAWIGPAGSAEPAPVLTVTGPGGEVEENDTPPASHNDGGDEPAPSPTPTTAPDATATTEPAPADEAAADDAAATAATPETTASPEPVEAADTDAGADDVDAGNADATDGAATDDAVDDAAGEDDATTELALTPAADDESGNGVLGLVALGLLLAAGGGAAWWWRTQQD